jgi:dihydroorotase
MERLILRGGHVLDPSQGIDLLADLVIEGGKVAGLLAPGVPAKGREIDVTGMFVAPGLVDIHVHLREPGFEYKETIETGANAAVAGGVTSVVAMPNTDPPPDTAAAVLGFVSRAKNVACHVYTVGSITQGRAGTELSEMADLVAAGVVGFSDDGSAVRNSRVLLNAMEYARPLGKPILSHCEDPDLAEGGQMHEGMVSAELGISGMPAIAEALGVIRDIALAEYSKAHLHVCHVSTAQSVEAIRSAKKSGATRITAETAPHYLALTDDAVRAFDSNTKMNPPLRTRADQDALREGLKDGTIDALATDHAPHSHEEKQVEFDAAPFGVIGLETSLGVCWTELVVKNILSPLQLIEKMSTNPARVCGLNAGTLAVGAPADVVLIDPKREWTVSSSFRSKSNNSPFVGWNLTGRAVLTLVGGEVRFDLDGTAA